MTAEPRDLDTHSHRNARFRGVSGRPMNRRVVLKASAGVAAIAAAGGIGATVVPAIAQERTRVTRSETYVPSGAEVEAIGEWHVFGAAYPFYALGASWDGNVGEWPVISVQLSTDGESWTETFRMTADNDGGQPTAADRTFTPLLHSSGGQFVRYRTVDFDGNPGVVEGLEFVYIDATDGPWEHDLVTATTRSVGASSQDLAPVGDNRTPPEIITRAQWGANEDFRFASYGEIWPPTYQTVSHIIIHHTATPNSQDIPTAIRSIYYYHAVIQEWGDIGYNYLVGRDGRIYEGRYGGQNVIGGHSYQFAVGSSGIGTIGNFERDVVPDASIAGLVAITAWVGRDLDPYATQDLLQAPDLPVITSHRDVNATTCPGDFLYNDLPEIRDLVAAALDELETPFAGGIAPGDRVRVQTSDGGALNVRSGPGTGSAVVGSVADGSYAMVIDGPVESTTGNWYMVDQATTGTSGWVTAQFLIVAPIPPPPSGDFPFGLNIIVADPVNLRSAPTTSASVVTTLAAGTLAFVLDGPRSANGFAWYQIQTVQGEDGWAASQFLEAAPFNENPVAAFAVGDVVEATEFTNIRSRPGIANTIIAGVSTGGRLEITQAPVGVNGYIFYGVYSQNDDGGWAVENTMRRVGTAPGGRFTVGDGVRVTESTNLRSSASTTALIIATMPAGTTGTIVAGPLTGSGYTWWQIQTSFGAGWAVENWLAPATTDPGGLVAQLIERLKAILGGLL
ncbi:MAG: SH3 domain-containing protein [Chloroflexia bacterium]|nr:SH3 domain-containing protein [Chloroflexia bacterium]